MVASAVVGDAGWAADVVGLTVFLIITLIQFIVIAKGSERVAEVEKLLNDVSERMENLNEKFRG